MTADTRGCEMDKISLEGAIKAEAEQAVLDITLKEKEEIRKLDEAYAAEIDQFKRAMQEETDAKIRQESTRMESRTSLEIKKIRLRSLETFINRIAEELAATIREQSQYKKFLLDAVNNSISQIKTGAEIRLKKEDLHLEQEIRTNLKAAGKAEDIIFAEGGEIKWGGCMVIDSSGGRIFDSSVERIYFRNSPQIQREAMKILLNYQGGTK